MGDTAEVNIFKDDNTVLNFKKPNLEYSVKEKVTFLTGKYEEKRKSLFKSRFEGSVAQHYQTTWSQTILLHERLR